MKDFLSLTIANASERRKFKNKFKNPVTYAWTMNPFLQTLIWVSAVGAGAWASLDAENIMSFNNPFLHFSSNIHWASVNFFAFISVITFLFSLSAWVKREQDSYVIDSLLTMPSNDFWVYFGEQFNIANDLIETDIINLTVALNNHKFNTSPSKMKELDAALIKSIVRFEEDIRRILDSTINLVKLWDSNNIANEKVIYRANIMKIHRFKDKLDETYLEELKKVSSRFTVKDVESHYTGFVSLLDNIFTTTTHSPEPEQDTIDPIGFGFTDPTDLPSEPFKTNILGAPEAAATGNYSYVKYPEEIIKYYEESDNVNQEVLKNLMHYYSSSEKADSILSIPIIDPDTDLPIYILNIYRNQTGLLFSGHKARDYSKIILPFTSLIRSGLGAISQAKITRD
jgi:hypothetical protein|tara:strand:- start:38421 stop:39614 length:1194 start_codon:yes stop_codon:yes gene_type:complete